MVLIFFNLRIRFICRFDVIFRNNDIFFQNNRESVYTCTSSSFEGVVAMMSPDDSWVAKWQRIGNLVKGCYAISVQGKLPTQVVQDLRSQGIMYRSRDTSTVAWGWNKTKIFLISKSTRVWEVDCSGRPRENFHSCTCIPLRYVYHAFWLVFHSCPISLCIVVVWLKINIFRCWIHSFFIHLGN